MCYFEANKKGVSPMEKALIGKYIYIRMEIINAYQKLYNAKITRIASNQLVYASCLLFVIEN